MSRLPAEWEKQSGVQLTWPHCETEWYELEKVLECYVEIASTILRFEPLMIVTRDIEECKGDIARISQAKGIQIDVDAIKFYECPLNDTWALVKPYCVDVDLYSLCLRNARDIAFTLLDVACHDHQRFKTEDCRCNLHITLENLLKFIPFGLAMRPRQLDSALLFPFCRQSAHISILGLNRVNRFKKQI